MSQDDKNQQWQNLCREGGHVPFWEKKKIGVTFVLKNCHLLNDLQIC